MVELDAPRFRGRLFGPYLLPTFTVSSADHSHTVTPAGTRCVVFFNGGNLAEAAVFPVGA